MAKEKWRARSRTDLIIEVWEALDCESVGLAELREIQKAIGERFGSGAVDSPAAIARTLADEGAVLRHPEVLDFDTQWREQSGPLNSSELDFSTLSDAAEAIRQVEEVRQTADPHRLRLLERFIKETREEVLLIARSSAVSSAARAEAREIAEWLSLWLKAPQLFFNWLELRLDSEEFRNQFPDH